MKKLITLLFCWVSFFAQGQVVDTTAVIRQVDSLIQISRTLTEQRDFDKALEVNAAAEKMALEKLGRESAGYGSCCFNRGRVNHFKNNYLETEWWYLEAKAIREKVLGKEHADYASCLNNLASLNRVIGNFEESELLFIEALAIYEKVWEKDHAGYGRCLLNMATLYMNIGNSEKAEPLLLEAIVIYEKFLGKDHPGYASCLSKLGDLYHGRGFYEKAEHFYLEAIAIQEKVFGKDHPDYAISINNIGALYNDMGKYEKAEQLFLDALVINEKIFGKDHPDYAISLCNIAIMYARMTSYEKAEPLFLEAIAIDERVFGKEHGNYAIDLMNLAILYKDMGKYEKAEQLFLEALVIYEKVWGKEHDRYPANLGCLADLYSEMAKPELAEPLYLEESSVNKIMVEKGLHHLSQKELNNYLSKFTKNQNQLLSSAQVSDSKKVVPACYDNSLFYKGFLLNAVNQIKRLALSDAHSAEKYNLLKSYGRHLAAEYAKPITERDSAKVVSLEDKAIALEKDLARTVAGFGEALRQVKWQEVQEMLQPGEAAIEFVRYTYYAAEPTDSIMYSAMVLRPGDEQPVFVPLFEEKQFQALINETAARRYEYVANLYQDQENSLYHLLWSPLEPFHQGAKTVYYSPAGLLHRLNLGAIAAPVVRGEQEGTVLADRYDLILLASTRQLVIPSTTATATATATVYGGIQYEADSTALVAANEAWSSLASTRGELSFTYADSTLRGGTWKYLKWTEQEASNIEAVLKEAGIPTEMQKGYAASETAFKQMGKDSPSPRILHISTHGFFFPDPKYQRADSPLGAGGVGEPVFKLSDHPMIRSGLILAGANHAWKTGKPLKPDMEDGILTAYEISQLDLSNTELVVLSACETGLGDIEGNEGVYGLQRAFKIAGAKNLIMSLWQVPDYHTQELMTSFYRNWLKEKMPIRHALQAAQQEKRRQGLEPFYWAGFVLVE